MKREGREEAGHTYGWKHKITLICPGGAVFVFLAMSRENHVQWKQIEEETLQEFNISDLPLGIMRNMRWIIPLCLEELEHPVVVHQADYGV